MSIESLDQQNYQLYQDYKTGKITRSELLSTLHFEISGLNIYELFKFYQLLDEVAYEK